MSLGQLPDHKHTIGRTIVPGRDALGIVASRHLFQSDELIEHAFTARVDVGLLEVK